MAGKVVEARMLGYAYNVLYAQQLKADPKLTLPKFNTWLWNTIMDGAKKAKVKK